MSKISNKHSSASEGEKEARDLEAGPTAISPEPSLDDANRDPNLIIWNGHKDPENPTNWPKDLKWKNTWTISLFVFISPVSSSMIAPAMNDLAKSLRVHTEIETGNENLHTGEKVETLGYKLLHAFERPVKMFTTQPIVFFMAISMAYLFGITYLMRRLIDAVELCLAATGALWYPAVTIDLFPYT
ncbi:hypothetical protein MYU51_019969 [Penicillium brevicompactum]|uniref:MFS general substrate transporter n=1 Tax=Penicillium brevicompactum TaxID=5074 RepID=UPI0025406F8B|nr:MFS general substrate transporter [Penicillium brevicompactum]KAJ5347053.1 MFS general substrate transporter [Penicillium brevicompactum]